MLELHNAVRSGDIDSVKDLLKKGADVNSADSEGQTPLFKTCYVQNTERATQIARFLIANGANVNVHNVNKQPPLYFAVGQNKLHLAKLFIESGANIENDFMNYCSPEALSMLAPYVLISNPKMKKPEFLYKRDENLKIWEINSKKITFYLEKNQETGTQAYKQGVFNKISKNKDLNSLRYLSFFAYNKELNIDKIDNISSLQQVCNSR